MHAWTVLHLALPAPVGLRPWDALERQIRAVHPGERVLLAGDEPTRSPHLLKVVRALAGRHVAVWTDGLALTAEARLVALRDAGVRELFIELRDDRARRTLDLARSVGLGVRLGVCRTPGDGPRAALDPSDLAQAASLGVGVALLRDRYDARRLPHDGALGDVWPSAVPVEAIGWTTALRASAAAPAPVDAALVAHLDAGLRPPAADGGVTGAVPAELGLRLAAGGVVPVGQPRCVGGDGRSAGPAAPACAPCPSRARCGGPTDGQLAQPLPPWRANPGRIAVLLPDLADRLMVMSTLPALARAVNGRLLTAWDLDFDPANLTPPWRPGWRRRVWEELRHLAGRPSMRTYTPPRDRIGRPGHWSEPPHRLRAIVRLWWDRLDLRDVDVIVAPGFEVAARAWTHPTRRPDARMIVADMHMLHGVDALRAVIGEWPEAITVHACFPGYAGLYVERGVPLRQVAWRPYPLFTGHFHGPDPSTSASIFCGGSHLRDDATLLAAAERLDGPPIDVIGPPDALRAVGPLRLRGMTPLGPFVDAVRQSRFVVLPLVDDPIRAAGISVLSMAHAAGRPVVATATPATRDHVRHGVDGILVPPGDPRALADAIREMDRHLAAFAVGARQAAGRLDVDAWAQAIRHGATDGPARAPDGWRAW